MSDWDPTANNFKLAESNPLDPTGRYGGNLNHGTVGTVAAQYVITCEGIFDSDIDGLAENSAPILWVESGCARLYTQDPTGEHSGDGKVMGINTLIYMKYGMWGPKLQEKLYKGTIIESIAIKRLASINGTKKILQTMTFTVCSIITYKQTNDIIAFNFNYSSRSDESTSLWQGDATENGKVASQFDFPSMVAGPA
ncbi:MAG: hypothetical protein LBT67_02320 [Holosporaceae bacterium]|jgi:hypothetical protein|nr:hypothetical protein [Holosporaceae bacterium]